MVRRVLHIPAQDVRVGDLISFIDSGPFMALPRHLQEKNVTEIERDPSDGDYRIVYADGYSKYYDPAEQVELLQEIN